MRVTTTKILLFALLLLGTATAQAEEALQATIDQVLKTYGGAGIWDKTTGIQQTGMTFSQARHMLGNTTRSYRFPDEMTIDIRYEDGESELRQMSGGQVWNHGQPANLPFAQATLLQSYRMAIPKQLLAHRHTAKDLGTREGEDGTVHRGIEIRYSPSTRMIIDIDANTGHILGTWGLMKMGEQEVQFATFYDDYRMVEGRLFALKEEHYAMGNYTGHTELEKISFVEEFAEEVFRPK